MKTVTDRLCDNLFESHVLAQLSQYPVDGIVTNNLLIPHIQDRWLPNELDILVLLPSLAYVIDAKALEKGTYRGPADGAWEFQSPQDKTFGPCYLPSHPTIVADKKRKVLAGYYQQRQRAKQERYEPKFVSIIVVPNDADIQGLRWDEARHGMRLPIVQLKDLNKTIERDFEEFHTSKGLPTTERLKELLNIEQAVTQVRESCYVSKDLVVDSELFEANFDGIPLTRHVFAGRRKYSKTDNFKERIDEGPSDPVRFEFIPKYEAGHYVQSQRAWRNYQAISARLNKHPAMLELVASYNRPTDYMLVFDLFSTVSLRDRLEVELYTWDQARRIVSPLLDLLRLAHSYNISHRFLSPACILIDEKRPTEVRLRGFHGALFPNLSAVSAVSEDSGYVDQFAAPEFGRVRGDDVEGNKRLDMHAFGKCIIAALTQKPDTRLDESIIPDAKVRSVIQGLASGSENDRVRAWEAIPGILQN